MRRNQPSERSSSFSKQEAVVPSYSQESSTPLTTFLHDVLCLTLEADDCGCGEMKTIRIIADDARIPCISVSPQVSKKVSFFGVHDGLSKRDDRWCEESTSERRTHGFSGSCLDSPLILPKRTSLHGDCNFVPKLDRTVHYLNEVLRIARETEE